MWRERAHDREEAVEQNTLDLQTVRDLVEFTYDSDPRLLGSEKDARVALDLTTRVLENSPTKEQRGEARFYEGACHFLRAEWKPAEEALKAANEDLEPGYRARLLLARLYEQQERASDAEDIYRKVIEQRPSLEWTFVRLSALLYDEGEYERSAEVVEDGLDTHSESAALWNNAGKIRARLSKFGEALIASKKAVELAPDSFVFRVNLGIVYFVREEFEAAEAELRKASELRPDDPALSSLLQDVARARREG